MRKLILDLLDLARIESGEKRRRLETVDVVESARAAVANAAPDAAAKAITLRINGESAVSMTADRNEIAMILDNLISNGIKYNREGGAVDVGVFSRDGGVVVQVSDTGFGLNPEEAARIFEEFVRIRTPKTEDILGSGLGLAIVKKIVGLYDGSISLDSRPEQGSTFTVMLKGQSNVPEDGKVYSIAASETGDKPAAMAGKKVSVTGTVAEKDGKMVVEVAEFKEAR
ncbi:MAG: hypothetical protein C4530_20065 [Desulfobacteraceae bacterium]|nr:MAG: hypothetical protein C4530_20065 [Desulfobacteraceae bacterium]